MAIAGIAENHDIKQKIAGVERVANKAQKGMMEKEEAKPWARATVKSLEANLQAKAKERKVGAPMGSKAVATTAGNTDTAPSGVRKEKTVRAAR